MRVVYAIGGFLLLATIAAASTSIESASCDRSYPDYCIPPPPPDLDCADIRGKKPFRVRRPDPHHFDRDRDGWACEPPKPARRQ